MKAILVVDIDKEVIEKLCKMNIKEMCVDIGFDYHLDCNDIGGWCFHRTKSLLSIKPMPQRKEIEWTDSFGKHNYKKGYNRCIDEILGEEKCLK